MTSFGPRIEPNFFAQDSILKLQQTPEGRSAVLLLLELRAHSFETLSDGFIPSYALRRASDHPDPLQGIEMLVVVGAAEPAENAKGEPGWTIDWSNQLSADAVRKIAKDKADWNRHINGNHRECVAHKGYNCHKNGDYKKWLAEHPEDLGDRDGDQAGDQHGISDLTRPDLTRSREGKERKGVVPPPSSSSDSVAGAPSSSSSSSSLHEKETQTGAPNRGWRI